MSMAAPNAWFDQRSVPATRRQLYAEVLFAGHRRVVVTAVLVDEHHPLDRPPGVVQRPNTAVTSCAWSLVHHHLAGPGAAVERQVGHPQVAQVRHGTGHPSRWLNRIRCRNAGPMRRTVAAYGVTSSAAADPEADSEDGASTVDPVDVFVGDEPAASGRPSDADEQAPSSSSTARGPTRAPGRDPMPSRVATRCGGARRGALWIRGVLPAAPTRLGSDADKESGAVAGGS